MQRYRTRVLMVLALLAWGLIGTHFLALHLFLYWTLPWFDILTHFWGGVLVGVLSLWLYYCSGYAASRQTQAPFSVGRGLAIILTSILVVGISWEVYEYVARAWWDLPIEHRAMEGYVLDTLLDLVMDVVGALVGLVLFIGLTKGGGATHPADHSQE